MRSQNVVSIEDLRFATIACRHCNTRLALDLSVEFSLDPPRECPRCRNPFDSAIPAALGALQRAYKALAPLGEAVTFTAGTTA